MLLDNYLNEDCIIITKKNIKNSLLEKNSNNHKISKIKFYDMQELLQNYTFEIDENALYEIVKKFEYKIMYAKKILELIYDVEDKKYKSNKLNDAVKVKKYLMENNFIYENIDLKTYLTNKKIYVYGYNYLTNKEGKLINYLKTKNNVVILKENIAKKDFIEITKCDTMEYEVISLATSIKELLTNGIKKENIKINIPNNEYRLYIKKIFTIFNIPCSIKETINLYSLDITRYFLKLLEDTNFEEALTIIRENYDLNNDILKKAYDKINEFAYLYSIHEDKLSFEILTYNIKNAKINVNINKLDIHEIDLDNELITDVDHVFMLGFMNTIFPKYKKDDDFLLDIEKEEIDELSHNTYNKIITDKLIDKINMIKNVYISYSISDNGTEFVKTSFLDKLAIYTKIEEKIYNYDYNERNYNEYLLSKNLDNYVRYGEISNELTLLYNNIDSLYEKYNHEYKEISKETLYKYLNNEINLSYSSIDTFFKCPFKFYLENILKIKEKKEKTLSLVVGNLVHNVLCIVFKEDREDYENVIDEVISSLEIEENAKNRFYLNKYKKEIIKLIQIIKNQNKNTKFKGTFYEKRFEIDKTRTLKITLKGFIDKVLTFSDDKNTFVIVVDYKTGKIETNFNPVIYGVNMQLLIYLKLLKENNIGIFGGAYWQNILSDVLTKVEGKTYEEVLIDNYRLDGYTLKNSSLAPIIDTNIDKSYIKGLKLKKDGEFYSTSKVLTEDEINKLLEITEDNINKCIEYIEKANFEIRPLKIGFEEESGCKFCNYKDICFKTDKDTNLVSEYKKLEFIKGDNDE